MRVSICRRTQTHETQVSRYKAHVCARALGLKSSTGATDLQLPSQLAPICTEQAASDTAEIATKHCKEIASQLVVTMACGSTGYSHCALWRAHRQLWL